MPKVNLRSSYGYLDPATGKRTYYGPGQGIEVPQGLIHTLGLKVIPEPVVETEPVFGSDSNTQPLVPDLPADFPGLKYLEQVGIVTLAQVEQLSIDDLIEIKGIGTRLAERILKEVPHA